MTDLLCEQPGCPIETEGRCLEGFVDVAACPHARRLSDSHEGEELIPTTVNDVDVDVDVDDEAPLATVEHVDRGEDQWVDLRGDVALTLEEADEVASVVPCRVVLVAGEFESGKTTLVVELYAQFLAGPFCGTKFGGSHTLRALDRRHHPAREASGEIRPTTDRTADDDMRLLHLRLLRFGRLHELLFSDVRGEYFENIIDGATVGTEVGIAPRADVCLLAVDGQSVAEPVERQRAFTRARLLLGGLAEPGGLKVGTATTIVLTKIDLLDTDARSWAAEELDRLRDWATDRGLAATVACVAARPPAGPPEGLENLLDQIIPVAEARPLPVVRPQPGDRQFWNQPENRG